jgi:hypothetical protein
LLVFLLIVLGFILKRSLMRLAPQWHGLRGGKTGSIPYDWPASQSVWSTAPKLLRP